MARVQKTAAHKPFWKTTPSKPGREKRFPFTLFEENDPKSMAVFGPGGGFGIGCGVGVGLGIVGGLGYGGGAWNHLKLAFGLGVGCGIGIGFGYGNGVGHGIGLDDFESRVIDKKKRNSKWVVIEI